MGSAHPRGSPTPDPSGYPNPEGASQGYPTPTAWGTPRGSAMVWSSPIEGLPDGLSGGWHRGIV